MSTAPSAPHGRLLAATILVSVGSLVVALAALLRPTPRSDGAADQLVAVQQELAELRRSVGITRSQQSGPGNFTDVTDLEARLARLEGQSPASVPRPVPSVTTTDPAAERSTADVASTKNGQAVASSPGKPAPSFSSPHPAVRIEAGPGGRITARNSDPALTGQKMTVFGVGADGRETSVTIVVPAPE